MRYVVNIIRKWRSYSLDRADYAKSMKKEFPNNLYSLWFLGIWFAIFSFVHFIIYFLAYGLSFAPFLFLALSIGSVFFAAYVHHKYKQHQAGKRTGNLLIYIMLLGMYATPMATGIFMATYINPYHLAVLYMVLLVCTPVLIFVSPFFSLLLTLGAVIAFGVISYFFTSDMIWGNNMRILSAVAPIALFFTWIANRYRILAALNAIKLEEERDKYRAQSTIDELTQLKNRRDFEQRFRRCLTKYRENDNFVCLAIVDIDFFKNYNDFYGHPKGDESLRAMGLALGATWDNPSMYAARIGGEEFALLWFEEHAENAQNVILEARQRIANLNIPHEKSGVSSRITCSIGVNIVMCGVSDNMQEVYNAADKALYEAKERGRNGAVIIGQGENQHIQG